MSSDRFTVKFAVDLIIRRGNEVLLSLRENTGWMDGRYHFVSGHVDGNEAPEEAIAREAMEEAGIVVDPKNLKLVFVTHRRNGDVSDEYVTLYFEATEWIGDIENREPEKSGGLDWFNIDTLPENIVPYVEDVLTDYAAGKNYFSIEGPDA